jgi:hypothetical protein
VDTPIDGGRYGPCDQSDARECQPHPASNGGHTHGLLRGPQRIRHRPRRDAGLSLHSRVSDWSHGSHRLASTGVWTVRTTGVDAPWCQIGYMDHTSSPPGASCVHGLIPKDSQRKVPTLPYKKERKKCTPRRPSRRPPLRACCLGTRGSGEEGAALPCVRPLFLCLLFKQLRCSPPQWFVAQAAPSLDRQLQKSQ